MHGTVDAGDIGWVLLWSAALVAVFAPLTMRLYTPSGSRGNSPGPDGHCARMQR